MKSFKQWLNESKQLKEAEEELEFGYGNNNENETYLYHNQRKGKIFEVCILIDNIDLGTKLNKNKIKAVDEFDALMSICNELYEDADYDELKITYKKACELYEKGLIEQATKQLSADIIKKYSDNKNDENLYYIKLGSKDIFYNKKYEDLFYKIEKEI